MRLLWFNLSVDRKRQGLAFAIDWLNSLAEQVEGIDVITMTAGDYQVRKNVRIYSVGKEKGYSEPRRAVEFYRILLHLLRHNKYDACFAHMMPLFVVMGAALLRWKGIPIVLWYTHKSVTLMLRLATFWVARVVTASQESFRIPSKKVRVIGHGIDTEKFVPATNKNLPSERPFTILTVGRLSPIKRIDSIIDTIHLLSQEMPAPSICLKVVGGPLTEKDTLYFTQLKQQVQQQQLQNIVFFMDSISFQEIVPYYQEADCFVSMSDTGSIDKAVLEAMSCEVPVVVPDTFKSILGERLAATLTVERNTGGLKDRLVHVIKMSAPERQALGRQLRAIVVGEHTLNNLCRRVLSELESVRR